MFDTLLLHPDSQAALYDFVKKPTHAALLYGPESNGKSLIARELATIFLGCTPQELANQPQFLEVVPDQKSKIGVDAVRSIGAFLSLKSLGSGTIRRVVIVQDAHTITVPAQQALLKVVEEPPEDTVILFVTSLQHQLLPTILSRVRRLFVRRPESSKLRQYLESMGVKSELTASAMVLSGGSVGSALSYLNETESDSTQTMARVKAVIGMPLFEQLLLVDTEFKESSTALAFATDLSKLAELSLHRSAGTKAAEQWLRISTAAELAVRNLSQNASTKLVMTELILSLRYIP